MVKKMRVGWRSSRSPPPSSPKSPFTEGKPNGFMSYRSHIWTDTDPDRSGMLPFVFEPGMGFERYVDYLLDVPMYFTYRDGQYVDVSGKSFRDFMAGRLPGHEGEIPGMGDFVDHMSTAFPEVRLKRYIEMRGADGGPWDRLCALPALWVGLLYNSQSLDAAWDLVKDWTTAEMQELRSQVPRLALKATFRGQPLQSLARRVVQIAREGLARRRKLDRMGGDEITLSQYFGADRQSGVTPAEVKLGLFNGRWNRSVDPVFAEFAY